MTKYQIMEKLNAILVALNPDGNVLIVNEKGNWLPYRNMDYAARLCNELMNDLRDDVSGESEYDKYVRAVTKMLEEMKIPKYKLETVSTTDD